MVPTHAQFRHYSIKDLSSSRLLVPCFPSLAMTSCILRFSLKYPAIEHVRCQEGLRDQDANWAKQLCAASWTRMLLPLSERYLQPLGVEFQFQFQGLAASRTTLVNRVMFCGGYLHVLGLTTCLGNYLPVNRVCCLGGSLPQPSHVHILPTDMRMVKP